MNKIKEILEKNKGSKIKDDNDLSDYLIANTKLLKDSDMSNINNIINHENFNSNFSLYYFINSFIKDNKMLNAEKLIDDHYSKISTDSFNKLAISAMVSNDYDIEFVKRLLAKDKINKEYFELSVMDTCISQSKEDIVDELLKIKNFSVRGHNDHHIYTAINFDKKGTILQKLLDANKSKFKDQSNSIMSCAISKGNFEMIKSIINDKNITLKRHYDELNLQWKLHENNNPEVVDYLFSHKKFSKVFDQRKLSTWFSDEQIELFKRTKKKSTMKIKQ